MIRHCIQPKLQFLVSCNIAFSGLTVDSPLQYIAVLCLVIGLVLISKFTFTVTLMYINICIIPTQEKTEFIAANEFHRKSYFPCRSYCIFHVLYKVAWLRLFVNCKLKLVQQQCELGDICKPPIVWSIHRGDWSVDSSSLHANQLPPTLLKFIVWIDLNQLGTITCNH